METGTRKSSQSRATRGRLCCTPGQQDLSWASKLPGWNWHRWSRQLLPMLNGKLNNTVSEILVLQLLDEVHKWSSAGGLDLICFCPQASLGLAMFGCFGNQQDKTHLCCQPGKEWVQCTQNPKSDFRFHLKFSACISGLVLAHESQLPAFAAGFPNIKTNEFEESCSYLALILCWHYIFLFRSLGTATRKSWFPISKQEKKWFMLQHKSK